MLLSEAKIMITEDSILARKQLKDILSGFGGKHFVEVSNGQEAIDTYAKEPADIVFLDIVMPVKDGIAAAGEIIGMNPSAILVMVSSIGTQEQLRKALEAGAKDFLQKPFSVSHLKRVVERFFELS